MSQRIKPVVVFSRCLGFEACRYNGQSILDKVVELIKPHVDAVTVCPEMAIGLGVPRHPIRLIESKDRLRLIQPQTELDCTEAMARFTDEFLSSLGAVDGFLLKYRSPSCGPSQVKVYNSPHPDAGHRKGAGAFGGAVVERFPTVPVEDEGRLANFDIRQHFLTRLFTHARFRDAQRAGTLRALIDFHTVHKLLLMAYHQTQLRDLGRLVASAKSLGLAQAFDAYSTGLGQALARAPRRTSAINVLQHAFGYVSKSLSSQERAFFLEALEQYRSHQVPLSVPASLMRSWILRFDVTYLADQIYFEPYPIELVEVLDSGKGRKL
jgi:uncharacterized protein YbgA (DUF1722 family)/uncharacterized protein YbbK (DUF523 family)